MTCPDCGKDMKYYPSRFTMICVCCEYEKPMTKVEFKDMINALLNKEGEG